MIKFLVSLLLVFQICYADISATPSSDVSTFSPKKQSHDLRASQDLLIGYTFSGSAGTMPLKHGPKIGTYLNSSLSLEGELSFGQFQYLPPQMGNLDILAMSQTGLNLVSRHFFENNSFNVFVGIGYRLDEWRFGNQTVSDLSGSEPPSEIEMIRYQSLGPIVGIGNRWSWNNGFFLGADWIEAEFPALPISRRSPIEDRIKDPEKKGALSKASDLVGLYPYINFLHMTLGWSF